MKRLLLILLLLLAPAETCSAQYGWLDPNAPVNRNSSLNRGLVGWWVALPEQQRGVIFRDIARGNHATLTSMNLATAWVGSRGRPGGYGALDCDGTNDYAGVNSAPVSAFPVSISCWVYKSTAATGYQAVFSLGYTVTTIRYVTLTVEQTTGEANYAIGGTLPASMTLSGTSAINDSKWHMLTGVSVSGSSHILYVDGVQAATGSTNVGGLILDRTTIGGLNYGSSTPIQFLSGRVDDCLVWNRALSANEVLALYQDSRSSHPQMIAWQGGARFAPDEAPPSGNNGSFLPLLGALRRPQLDWSNVAVRDESPFALAP